MWVKNRRTLLLVVLACAISAGDGPAGRADDATVPGELVEFGPASRDPLFTGGGPDAWDRDLRERGWIIRQGGRWHLWYTGSNLDRSPVRMLGHASGPDGLNWTRTSDAPVVPDTWVEDVCIVRLRGCSHMFAEGEHDIAHWLTSIDQRCWQPRGPLDIRLVDGRPIPDGPRGTPAVWHENGTWYLFYERHDLGVWLATSRCLPLFTNVSDDPVLTCGPDPHDRAMIAMDQIIRHRGRYYAYYHAHSGAKPADGGGWCTCLAASDDLVHWVKYAGNPVLPVDPEHPSRSSATLVFDGSRHRLYTTHPDVRVRFAVATVPGR